MFPDHDETSSLIAAVTAPSVAYVPCSRCSNRKGSARHDEVARRWHEDINQWYYM